jgi:hypothetical protein
MDLTFTSRGCDHSCVHNRDYHAKSEVFRGWAATESSVALDYIDPNVVPTTCDWYFCGWLTPRGGQPQNYPPYDDMMA